MEDLNDIKVIKKDGTLEDFNPSKIIKAVQKSAARVIVELTEEDKNKIVSRVKKGILESGSKEIPISKMHLFVESALEKINKDVAKSYRDYRNYKVDFVNMIDEVYKESQKIMYIGDRDNANTDSALVSTKRSLIYNQLNKELYKKFFLTTEELQAIHDGYIYIHDMGARRDSINCCLFNMSNLLKNGFEMGNVWYNEPNSLDTAFDVISDVTLSAASSQYGGFTISEVDKVLAPYAEKSYDKYYQERLDIIAEDGGDITTTEAEEKAKKYAMAKVQRDFEQGFQGWEYKFNTVGSSRGDYPFIAVSFGIGKEKFSKMATKIILKVRREGQGKKGFKKPVLFPKLTFLYDENLHGEGKELENLFEEAIECSSKSMYPDYLSLTGEGYIPSIYKKYGKVISLMG